MTESSAKPALLDHSLAEIRALFTERGLPAFRGAQCYGWLLKGRDFDGMGNLPLALRELLKERFAIGGAVILQERSSSKGDSVKYIFQLEDGNIVEGVLLSYEHGKTLCLSTQVGCRMGCVFCASTGDGLIRHLTPGEMLGQVISANASLGEGRNITNLVLMGSGEPLDNYENTIAFLRLVTSPDGLNISPRNISLSTCGLKEKIRRLSGEGLPVTLCISLHASDDGTRRKLMPVAASATIAELVDEAQAYAEATGRRVIYEYALIAGVNDSEQDARRLAALLRGKLCHVNLIPLNSTPESLFRGSARRNVENFLSMLQSLHISATRRRTMGEDIDGACGQLRQRILHPQGKEDQP